MSRWSRPAVALAAIAAAAAPLWQVTSARPHAVAAWPKAYEGRALTRLAAAPEDAVLTANFPGAIARFSDGRQQIVLRQLTAATRRLHPARDCFHALGYRISPAPMLVARDGGASSCFQADRDGRRLRICEQVRDADGRRFPDIPSWYWPALLGSSRGPWLAAMSVERIA